MITKSFMNDFPNSYVEQLGKYVTNYSLYKITARSRKIWQ